MERANYILVLDDDPDMCALVAETLVRDGYRVEIATDSRRAEELIERHDFAVILADIELEGGESGLGICAKVAAKNPKIPVILMTGHDRADTAQLARRAGAYGCIAKPLAMEELLLLVARAVEHYELEHKAQRLESMVSDRSGESTLIGNSPAMQVLSDMIDQVAPLNANILLEGERDTGKTLVGRTIHQRSKRADAPFVTVHCDRVPLALWVEEDGEGGRNVPGLFARAAGGTLLLREIRKMDGNVQQLVATTIQQCPDIRIIATTSGDIEQAVERGEFRRDLYQALYVVRMQVPPLRMRRQDITLLAQYFLDQASSATRRNVRSIDPDATRRMLEYDWPGNVRELRNCIEHAVAVTHGDQITVRDLPGRLQSTEVPFVEVDGCAPDELPSLDEIEQRYIHRVLDAVQGNKSHASRVLGVDRRTLYRKLERSSANKPEDEVPKDPSAAGGAGLTPH